MWAGGALRRGSRSRPFAPHELTIDALHERTFPGADSVGVEVSVREEGGRLAARGGVPRAVRAARLAAAAPHATALLAVSACTCTGTGTDADADAGSGTRLQLRLAADAAPGQELLLWFDDHALAHLDMPFLTLRNITGDKNYVCHECGSQFEQPNPLKIHLFLSCGTRDLAAFWRLCAARLLAAPPSAHPAPPPAPLPAPHPARLEALATAWGRARDGHVCVYCGKLYSRKYGLKIHIRTHTGYKPLRCRHCLRAFGDPSNLNKHVRLHARAPAAHACPLCRKPLARRRDLLRHLRAHHSPAP